tara:strand:- start:397 stop:552 length:156 start_codon:yes stop_codon:yes gene_type:complete
MEKVNFTNLEIKFLKNENYRLKEKNKRLMRILGIKWCINNKDLILKTSTKK